MTGSPSVKHHVFVLILTQVAEHFDHAGNQLAQIGVVPFRVAHTGKIEELFSDLLAAKRFFLNHLEVAAHHVALGRIAVAGLAQQFG